MAKNILGAFILSLILLTGVKVANAAEISTIAISPLTFEITANPGDIITNALRVFNPGEEPVTIAVNIEDFSPTGETGQAIVETAETTTYSIASWTTIENTEFTLGPGEQAVVNHTIRVPVNAEPGGHYGAITAEARSGAFVGGSGTALSQKVASLLLVAIAGDVREDLTITDFVGPSDVVLNASVVTLASRFENKGTVHVKPRGFVTVTDMFGRELATIALDQNNVLPGSKRLVETQWKPDRFIIGPLSAQLTAIYGSTNEPIAATTSFWMLPINVVGPVGGGLLIILVGGFLLRKRLGMAFSVLIRGKNKE